MSIADAPALPGGASLPLFEAAELQDHLLVASNSLERLQRLLADAGDALIGHFTGAAARLAAGSTDEARRVLAGAVTALQFQDMAMQLIAHTTRRLRSVADRLACDAFAGDDEGEPVVEPAPLRPNPVTQDEMDAGSIELF
jgi:hypothetical protein